MSKRKHSDSTVGNAESRSPTESDERPRKTHRLVDENARPKKGERISISRLAKRYNIVILRLPPDITDRRGQKKWKRQQRKCALLKLDFLQRASKLRTLGDTDRRDRKRWTKRARIAALWEASESVATMVPSVWSQPRGKHRKHMHSALPLSGEALKSTKQISLNPDATTEFAAIPIVCDSHVEAANIAPTASCPQPRSKLVEQWSTTYLPTLPAKRWIDNTPSLTSSATINVGTGHKTLSGRVTNMKPQRTDMSRNSAGRPARSDPPIKGRSVPASNSSSPEYSLQIDKDGALRSTWQALGKSSTRPSIAKLQVPRKAISVPTYFGVGSLAEARQRLAQLDDSDDEDSHSDEEVVEADACSANTRAHMREMTREDSHNNRDTNEAHWSDGGAGNPNPEMVAYRIPRSSSGNADIVRSASADVVANRQPSPQVSETASLHQDQPSTPTPVSGISRSPLQSLVRRTRSATGVKSPHFPGPKKHKKVKRVSDTLSKATLEFEDVIRCPVESEGESQSSRIDDSMQLETVAENPPQQPPTRSEKNSTVNSSLAAADIVQRRTPRTKIKITRSTSDYFIPGTVDRVDRPARRGESAIRAPPITESVFGIIQEKVWSEPFWLLIAVKFLNVTRGRAAIPLFWELKSKYPTPEDLALAPHEDLMELTRPLGLQRVRSVMIIQMAKSWIQNPPTVGRRVRTLHYPSAGNGKSLKKTSVLEDSADVSDGALELGGFPGCNRYAYDSWRIFCRDVCRGVADDYNGTGAAATAADGFQPEWQRVLPQDKELRAFLAWQWLRIGWVWDCQTGDKVRATDEHMEQAKRGALEVENGSTLDNSERAGGKTDARSQDVVMEDLSHVEDERGSATVLDAPHEVGMRLTGDRDATVLDIIL